MKVEAFARSAVRALPLLMLGGALVACASAPATNHRDPWEGWNRGAQRFNDTLDDYVMKPVAQGYQKVTPSFVDRGVTNFFGNIRNISTVVNDVLQFKFAQAGRDTGRFLVNTVAGLGGFVDIASKMDLPKHNEDFDQTLAVWGVSSGPYLVLPFIGPSTPRGLFGIGGDTAANPLNWISPATIPWGTGTLDLIDMRADLLSATKIVDEASLDRYEFIRNAYFQDRKYHIYDGNPPLDEELEREMELELEGQLDPAREGGAPDIQANAAGVNN